MMCRAWLVAVLVVLLRQPARSFSVHRYGRRGRTWLTTGCSALSMATTYVSVELPSAPSPTKSARSSAKRSVLVRSGAREVLDTIASWTGVVDEFKLSDWQERGLVFPSTAEGTAAMQEVEARRDATARRSRKFRGTLRFAADMYVETSVSGGDATSVLVKSSKAQPSLLNQIAEAQSTTQLDELIRRGVVFTNASKVFVDEQLVGRANSIATRLQNDFPISSPEWKRWTDKTTLYNATSLTQVMATYFQENSIGDVGGASANYIPKRGYPGTLAPGEKFTDNYPLEELPRRILHPWPAMQEIQFHVRYPPNHPLLPPPLLWFGLNKMYTDNFTEWQLSLASDEIVGGASMEPKDAIRIAQFAKLGRSYEPSEQIEHGGMIFSGGHKIPFYNPDHGPTVSDEQAKPPVPTHLLPITERWLDPLHGLDIPVIKTAIELSELEDDLEEQEVRKFVVENLLLGASGETVATPELSEWEAGKRRVEDELTQVLILRNDAMESPVEWHEDEAEKVPMDIETLASKMSEASKERDLARQLTDSIFGKPLGKRQLVGYVVDSFRDMQQEIYKAERDIASRRKGGKRRSRKSKSTDNEDDSDDEDVLPLDDVVLPPDV